jgi:hypothetical protein
MFTTSVAAVHAVMLEFGLNVTDYTQDGIGRLLY